MNTIHRADSSGKLVLACARLQDTLEDLKSISVLKFSEDAGNIYAELLRQKIRVGTQDLRIAAIARVPKEDIVLGFHAPYKRQFTDFAVG